MDTKHRRDRVIQEAFGTHALVEFVFVLLEVFYVFHQTTFDVLVEEKLREHVELLAKVLVGEVDLCGAVKRKGVFFREREAGQRRILPLCS